MLVFPKAERTKPHTPKGIITSRGHQTPPTKLLLQINRDALLRCRGKEDKN